MTNNELIAESYPHHYRLIELMCEVIDVDPDTVDLTDHKWYCNHTWSKEEYEKWLEKATEHLKNNEEARNKLMIRPTNRKRRIKKTLGINDIGWAFNYGWQRSEDWELSNNG